MKTFQLRTPHISKEGRVLSWTALLYGIGVSLLLPVFPTFIEDLINSESFVGYFYSGMSIATIIAGIISVYIYRKYSRSQVLSVVFVICTLMMLSLVFIDSTKELIFVGFIQTFTAFLSAMTLALMVNDYTDSKNLGKTEGVYFFTTNLGWLIGAFSGGIIGKYYGVEPVFALAGLMLMAAFLYISHQKFIEQKTALNVPQKEHIKLSTIKRIAGFFASPIRTKAFLVAHVYAMWLALKAVVIPLFVKDAGFGSDTTGLIMALAIIPFILFEMPVGKYVDKHGFKKPFLYGFLILGFCALAVFVSPFFLLDAILIIVANIGASFIEPLQDTYFFKNTTKQEEDEYYGIFMTSTPFGKFTAPLIISTILVFASFKTVFLVFGLIFILAAFYASRIKNQIKN